MGQPTTYHVWSWGVEVGVSAETLSTSETQTRKFQRMRMSRGTPTSDLLGRTAVCGEEITSVLGL